MSNRTILKTATIILVVGSLSACGDKISQPPDPNTPPAVTPPSASSFQARISSAFAAIFDRGVEQDPVDPQASDVPPLAPASDPIDN